MQGGVDGCVMVRVGGHGCACEGVSGRARACVRGCVQVGIRIRGQRVWVWACLGVRACIVVVLREGVAWVSPTVRHEKQKKEIQ